MEQAQRDETGQCVVCGRESMFRFDPTIIILQLREAWGISDRLVEAFNRKESYVLRQLRQQSSIMIPNSLFHELGGFDRRYLPACYEDVDLTFTVRKAGKRVLLQPFVTNRSCRGSFFGDRHQRRRQELSANQPR